MNFKNIKNLEEEAYLNCKNLYDKNEAIFRNFNYNKEEINNLLLAIYKIFSFLDDKGRAYTNLIFSNNNFILFKDSSYLLPGCISIEIYKNFMQLESKFDDITGNRNFIRLTVTPDNIYTTGYLKESGKPAITIRGEKQKGLSIITPQTRYVIANEETWHVFATLVDSTLNDSYFKTIKNQEDLLSKLNMTLKTRNLQEYQENLLKLLNIYLPDFTYLKYWQINISNFFVATALDNYLKDIKGTKESIKGLDADIKAIEKFINYQVTDEFTKKKRKLIDIPLYLRDTIEQTQCEFLDVLSTLEEKDIDIYLVGLAYFATYCQDFGILSGRNFYGANIYMRYAGYKMNVATKSTVLGIPLIEYAKARSNDNYPEIATFFQMLGFDLDKDSKSPTDISLFKNLLPFKVLNKTRHL